jgi:RHS repeat-associated protein
VLKPGATTPDLYYIHADPLGTPRQISRPSDNKVVWAWESEAFGASLPDQDPSGLGTFVFNLRFPGQYYDAETGLHYNYFRDYDPRTGRYIQSDPIGLAGGLNTYAYVRNNSVNLVDPSGNIPLDTIWDIGNVLYDIAKGNSCDLAADMTAMMLPYVPAGITKVPKITKGVDLNLKYKPDWTDAQKASACKKCQALTEADTVVTRVQRSGTSAASRYKSAGNTVPKGHDIDHIHDIQLGGSESALSNLSPLDASVNRSLGSQIHHQIKDLPSGTVINRVNIE